MKLHQEKSTIRVDPSNSTISGAGQAGSRQNFEGLSKIKEAPAEESKVEKYTPPSQRLLSSVEMHQSPISFGSNSKLTASNQAKMNAPTSQI